MTCRHVAPGPTPPDPTPPAPAVPGGTQGLYGRRGWSLETGVWALLAPWVPSAGSSLLCVPAAAAAVPAEDYVPFRGLDAATARELLAVLPGRALWDRQNQAPSLGALLAACADADGTVRLSGYGIGPQREDERLSVEAMWVGDTDLADYEVDERHGPRCQCDSLWRAVARRYRLDARDGPDEVLRTRPEWAGGAPGWRLWWD